MAQKEASEQTKANQQRLRSNAYGTHQDRRLKRKHTRQTQLDEAIEDSQDG